MHRFSFSSLSQLYCIFQRCIYIHLCHYNSSFESSSSNSKYRQYNPTIASMLDVNKSPTDWSHNSTIEKGNRLVTQFHHRKSTVDQYRHQYNIISISYHTIPYHTVYIVSITYLCFSMICITTAP